MFDAESCPGGFSGVKFCNDAAKGGKDREQQKNQADEAHKPMYWRSRVKQSRGLQEASFIAVSHIAFLDDYLSCHDQHTTWDSPLVSYVGVNHDTELLDLKRICLYYYPIISPPHKTGLPSIISINAPGGFQFTHSCCLTIVRDVKSLSLSLSLLVLMQAKRVSHLCFCYQTPHTPIEDSKPVIT